ncbi:MAG: hypothetical protein ABW003_09800 [Microvirga sp.]
MSQTVAARPWTDPPAELGLSAPPPTPSPPAQMPAPAPAAEAPPALPQQEAKPQPSVPEPKPEIETANRPTRDEKAKTFVMTYLDTWSSPNERALDATAELYAPRVLFHGRTVSMDRVFKQKERFVRRWPEREYRPRDNATGAECNAAGTLCTVHTVFDYIAANPRRGRFSQGAGALQLVVQFIGDKPVIVAEHSTVITQKRKRTLASENASNE